jgi:hypothetical protein
MASPLLPFCLPALSRRVRSKTVQCRRFPFGDISFKFRFAGRVASTVFPACIPWVADAAFLHALNLGCRTDRGLPGRRRDHRRKLQPPLSKGQPSHATLTQSSCECRSQDQRKHSSRSCIATRSRAWDTIKHRGHCPSTVSTDLADPAPGSPLRRTWPSGHQTIEATPYLEDDPATLKLRLSDRATKS